MRLAPQATYAAGGSAATDWGLGETDTTFGAGFTTSIDIYLKFGTTNDTRFDWDTALNNSSGGFLRDFGFIGGYYNNTDATGTGDRFVINAGNNFGRGNSNPEDPGHDPFVILTQGWYTFTQTFTNNRGTLLDTLQIYNTATNALLHTWTLGGDPIANVGGPRYGWVVENEFSSLAIDNTSLTMNVVPEPKTLADLALGAGLTLGIMAWRRQRRAAL
ncbi:MAG TPA: PEP-CTERM sorting domain-containing protein [Chthoniobacterales bacterium]